MKLDNRVYFLNLNSQNSLKRAMSILKHLGNPSLKVSYSSGSNSIHKNLSVKDNIEVDILNRVFSRKEMSIENMRERLKRLGLFDYYQLLDIPSILHTTMSRLTNQQITLYSHFKAITRGKDAVIFDSPASGLDRENLENLKTCIKSCSLTRPIIICSKNSIQFNNLIDSYIKDDNKKISITKNMLKETNNLNILEQIDDLPSISA